MTTATVPEPREQKHVSHPQHGCACAEPGKRDEWVRPPARSCNRLQKWRYRLLGVIFTRNDVDGTSVHLLVRPTHADLTTLEGRSDTAEASCSNRADSLLPELPMSPRDSSAAERQIQVRQVTHVQASWTETERGRPGAFTLQLILDHGADEYVLRPSAEDADVLVKLLGRSKSAAFDVDRKVLIFATLAIG
jgi:hypothetical protein